VEVAINCKKWRAFQESTASLHSRNKNCRSTAKSWRA